MKIFYKLTKFKFTQNEKFRKILEYLDVDQFKRENQIYDQLLNNLEKQNFMAFNKNLEFCRNQKIILKNEEINKIFSLITSQKSNISVFENIHEYISENNLNLDSIGYTYLINNYLKFKGFSQGYLIFYFAKLNNTKVDLSVYFNLFHSIDHMKNNHQISLGARKYLITALYRDFDLETIRTFETSIMDIQDHIIRKIKINNLKENKHDKLNLEKSELSKKFNDNKDKSNQEQSIDFPTITQKNEKYRDFHKIDKRILKKNDEKSSKLTELDIKTKYKRFSEKERKYLLKQREEILNELKLNKNEKIDFHNLSKGKLEKIKILFEILNVLSEENSVDKEISGNMNNTLSSLILLKMYNFDFVFKFFIKDGNNNENDDENNSGEE